MELIAVQIQYNIQSFQGIHISFMQRISKSSYVEKWKSQSFLSYTMLQDVTHTVCVENDPQLLLYQILAQYL